MRNKNKYFRNFIANVIKDIDLESIETYEKVDYTVLIKGTCAEVHIADIGYRELRIEIKWGKVRCTCFFERLKGRFIQGDTLRTIFNNKWDDSLLEFELPKDIDFKTIGRFLS